MEFDARLLSAGWLAVSEVMGRDKERPQFNRTVFVEVFDDGARLSACNGFVAVSSFVPKTGSSFLDEPADDELPNLTALLHDPDQRARGLMQYVWGKSAVDSEAPMIDVRLKLDQPKLRKSDEEDELFPSKWGQLEVPDMERVQLRTLALGFLDLRAMRRRFQPDEVKAIGLSPLACGSVAKAARWLGASVVLAWQWSGAQSLALVEFERAEPSVEAIVMPARSETADDANREAGDGIVSHVEVGEEGAVDGPIPEKPTRKPRLRTVRT